MAATGTTMATPEGTLWRFDAGSLFLEFLLAGGPGELAAFNSLRAPADLGRWAQSSRLGLASDSTSVGDRDIAVARQLRDALWRLTWAAIGAAPLPAADRAIANRVATRPALAPQLGPAGELRWLVPATGAAVLSTVARDAIAVLTGPMAGRLRECEAGDCRLVFLDTSRPGSRRWCSMQRCGNRHKIRALRTRRGSAASGTLERSAAHDG